MNSLAAFGRGLLWATAIGIVAFFYGFYGVASGWLGLWTLVVLAAASVGVLGLSRGCSKGIAGVNNYQMCILAIWFGHLNGTMALGRRLGHRMVLHQLFVALVVFRGGRGDHSFRFFPQVGLPESPHDSCRRGRLACPCRACRLRLRTTSLQPRTTRCHVSCGAVLPARDRVFARRQKPCHGGWHHRLGQRRASMGRHHWPCPGGVRKGASQQRNGKRRRAMLWKSARTGCLLVFVCLSASGQQDRNPNLGSGDPGAQAAFAMG